MASFIKHRQRWSNEGPSIVYDLKRAFIEGYTKTLVYQDFSSLISFLVSIIGNILEAADKP